MAKLKIVDGTVTIDGQIYRAFENSFTRNWYIVRGTRANEPQEAREIKATTPNGAIRQWLRMISKGG